MKRLAAITKRLHDEAAPDKNTDQKLDDGSTFAWVVHSEADVSWLLKRVGEFLEAGKQIVAELNARIDAAPDNAKPVFHGLAELHTAIQRTITADDTKPLSEAITEARGGDAPVKMRRYA